MQGPGFLEVELSFLDDVRLDCKVCEGRRYRDDVLKLTYHGRSIHDVLEMTVADALGFFASVESPRKRSARIGGGLQILVDVGVGYLRLGQSLSTLSGGEAQRLKLASELTRSGNVYVMDEPTTGLHPADIDRLLTIVSSWAATRWSSSSTTSTSSPPPTGSSTSDRRVGRAAAPLSPRARRRPSPPTARPATRGVT